MSTQQQTIQQIPQILLIFETRFSEAQAVSYLTELSQFKQTLISTHQFSTIKHFKEMTPLELSYASIDYLIAVMYSNIKPSSEESFFLQSYHYNLFMKFVCNI